MPRDILVSDVPAFRSLWFPLARAADVADVPVHRRLLGADLVLWRPSDGTVRAAHDACPHRAGPLSEGSVAGDHLVCPYHGWSFDGTGRCQVVPSAPDTPAPPTAVLRNVAAQERYGLVWGCLEPEAGSGPPDLVEAEPHHGYTLIHELFDRWDASALRVMDNALDVSHIPFVHRGTVGSPDHPEVSPYSVERTPAGLRFSLTYTARLDDRMKRNTGIDADTTTRVTHVELLHPFVYRGVLEYPANGLRHVLFKTATPIDDESTMFCQFIARNDDPPESMWESITGVDRAVQAEDRALLARVPKPFPLDLGSEVHVAADRMTVEYRRLVAEWLARSR